MELPVGLLALILLVMIFTFVLSGVWIGVALALTGFLSFLIFTPGKQAVIPVVTFNILDSYPLAAIPLFVFMGDVFIRSGLSERLYSGVGKITGIIPGGAVHSNIVACAIFAALSGSSAATAATIGSVAFPEQTRLGYNRRLVFGSLTAGGTLGILIPPSVTMILYGAFTGESVGKLFLGGWIPGILLSGLFMSYIFIWSLKNPESGPPRQRFTPRYFNGLAAAFKELWPIAILVFLIMGSIYGGIATPTEAAAVSAVLAVVLGAVFGKLTFKIIKDAALTTVSMAGALGFVIIGANTLAYFLGMAKIPSMLSETVLASGMDKGWIYFLVVVLYLILGCFMDGISLMLLTIPVTYPLIVKTLGFDGIWFGVLVTMLVEAALVTPPVGMNLFVLQTVSGEKDLGDVIKGSIPFFYCMLLAIALCSFFPSLVTFVPNTMMSSGF
jgi:C4-dicarboxylate transporter DctM subunit